jgi:YegS/Rv2252/BmrU family lipid kinase
MQAYLLYNPRAGRNAQRATTVAAVVQILESQGYVVQVAATTSRASAKEQVRAAIVAGARTIFACGGDGTVHDVLQGIAGTDAILGVIPMGSANALCRELRIPMDPIKAASAYLQAKPQRFALGSCDYGNERRFFLTLAGAGPDGALMYRMLSSERKRWGRWSYAWHALHLLFRQRFRAFPIRYCHAATGEWHSTEAVSVLAIRVGSLGGIFPGIARGASLSEAKLLLVMVKPPAILALPLWFLMNWSGLDRLNPLLGKVWVTSCECLAVEQRVHVQADGEWLGQLPLRIELLSQGIHILIP